MVRVALVAGWFPTLAQSGDGSASVTGNLLHPFPTNNPLQTLPSYRQL